MTVNKKNNKILILLIKCMLIVFFLLPSLGCTATNSVKNDTNSLSSISQSDTPVEIEIKVVVVDENNAKVQNVDVSAYDSDDAQLSSKTTDSNGKLTLNINQIPNSTIYLKTNKTGTKQFEIEVNSSSFEYTVRI